VDEIAVPKRKIFFFNVKPYQITALRGGGVTLCHRGKLRQSRVNIGVKGAIATKLAAR